MPSAPCPHGALAVSERGMRSEWNEELAAKELALLIREYGSPLFEYVGRGEVTGDAPNTSGAKWPCVFVAAQLRTGQIIIVCDMAPVDGPVPMVMMATAFEGTTLEGARV